MTSWAKITQKNLDVSVINKLSKNEDNIIINNEPDTNELMYTNDDIFDNIYKPNIFDIIYEVSIKNTDNICNINPSLITEFFIENIDIDKYVKDNYVLDDNEELANENE